MSNFITWCNTNTGFLTAVQSTVGLLLSIIAIIVSIRTARLPYKKGIKLSSSTDIVFSKDINSGNVISEIIGISVNAINIGFRNINIAYLGIIVRDKELNGKLQKLTKIQDEITGMGIIAPTEIKTELYNKEDLLYTLSKLSKKAKIYLYAYDTEGQEYRKRLGNANDIARTLSPHRE